MFIQFVLGPLWGDYALACDGVFGPKTAAAIKGFQRATSGRLKVDGKINAVDGTKLRSTVSKTVYTILEINAEMIKYTPLTFEDLGGDHKFPLALKALLSGKSRYISPFSVQTLVN